MKHTTLAAVLLLTILLSCHKESKLPHTRDTLTQMKIDPEFKDFVYATRHWVEQTTPKLPRDTAAIISYLKHSTETLALQEQGARIRAKYQLGEYSQAEAKQIVREAFLYYMHAPQERISSSAGIAMEEDPMAFKPAGKCYDRLIEDVSDCDEDMVIQSAGATLGIVGGFFVYAVAQATAFILHSRCVDRAHVEYKRCLEDENPGSGIITPEDPLIDTTLIFEEPVLIDN